MADNFIVREKGMHRLPCKVHEVFHNDIKIGGLLHPPTKDMMRGLLNLGRTKLKFDKQKKRFTKS